MVNQLPLRPAAIICDIDGTLAHMDGKRGPFDFRKVGLDRLDKAVSLVVYSLHSSGIKIVLLSGRDDSCRPETEAWLEENRVPYDILLMRKSKDNRKDSIIKREIYERDIEPNWDVKFILDDRDQVVTMWREELGLQCFQVAPGNF